VKTLYVFCEGRTEQGFCNQVLAPHLYGFGFEWIPSIPVAFSRKKGIIHRGGIRSYGPMRADMMNTMKRPSAQAPDVFFTTMIDVYGLPRGFPGKSRHTRNPRNPMPFVHALEKEFARDINHPRFLPYLQLHEYETLLFANPDAFEIAFDDCAAAIAALRAIADAVPTIEHIDDGRSTAPSKRVIAVLPAYEGLKASAGPDIATIIGLPTLRQKCPHFNEWIKKLEQL
jgi:hypothetical protein